MLAVYLAALVFGLVLIGASLFLGGDSGGHDPGHAGFHHAGPHAESHDGQTQGLLLSDLLSLRFWTWALGAFGMTGTALTLLRVPAAIDLPVSIGLGFVVGASTTWIFRRLRHGAVGAPPATENLLGAEGEVVLPLRAEGVGKVRLRVADQDFEIMARGNGTEFIGIKEKVVIIRFRDGIADVRPAPWKDLE